MRLNITSLNSVARSLMFKFGGSQIFTVQLTTKFTSHAIFSHVEFEALAKTCIPHTSELIAHVGLVHASQIFLDCVREYFTYLIMKQTNRASTQLVTQISMYSVTYVPLSQSTIVTLYHFNNLTLNNDTRKIKIAYTRALTCVVSQSAHDKVRQLKNWCYLCGSSRYRKGACSAY